MKKIRIAFKPEVSSIYNHTSYQIIEQRRNYSMLHLLLLTTNKRLKARETII